MQKLKRALILVITTASIAWVGVAAAEHHESDEAKKTYKELKREHRKEKREHRRSRKADSMLAKVDVNKDGHVDLDEYLQHSQARFQRMDLDSNGFVTKEEVQESMSRVRKERKEMRKALKEERRGDK